MDCSGGRASWEEDSMQVGVTATDPPPNLNLPTVDGISTVNHGLSLAIDLCLCVPKPMQPPLDTRHQQHPQPV